MDDSISLTPFVHLLKPEPCRLQKKKKMINGIKGLMPLNRASEVEHVSRMLIIFN